MAKDSALVHMGRRQYRIADAIGRGQRRVFVPPVCARCGRYCQDTRGEPRWDVVWPLAFVCLGGCQPTGRRGAVRR